MVPGCRHVTFVELDEPACLFMRLSSDLLHHIEPRADGGAHDARAVGGRYGDALLRALRVLTERVGSAVQGALGINVLGSHTA